MGRRRFHPFKRDSSSSQSSFSHFRPSQIWSELAFSESLPKSTIDLDSLIPYHIHYSVSRLTASSIQEATHSYFFVHDNCDYVFKTEACFFNDRIFRGR